MLDDLPQLLNGWAAAMSAAPEELSTMFVLRPSFGDLPAGATLIACYCGDDAGEMDPLRSIGNVVADDVTEMAYADVLVEAQTPPGVLPVAGNTLVEELTDACIDAIVTAYERGSRVIFLRNLGGAMGRVAPEATAFAHRSARTLVVSGKFLPLDASERAIAAAREEWLTIGQHGIGAYAGFMASDTADDLALLYPPETLARLVNIKRAWDPDNIFRRNFNIRP